MWTRPTDRAPSYGACGQALEKLALPHRLPTLGALAPASSPLLTTTIHQKGERHRLPPASRIAPSSQAIRLRNTRQILAVIPRDKARNNTGRRARCARTSRRCTAIAPGCWRPSSTSASTPARACARRTGFGSVRVPGADATTAPMVRPRRARRCISTSSSRLGASASACPPPVWPR